MRNNICIAIAAFALVEFTSSIAPVFVRDASAQQKKAWCGYTCCLKRNEQNTNKHQFCYRVTGGREKPIITPYGMGRRHQHEGSRGDIHELIAEA